MYFTSRSGTGCQRVRPVAVDEAIDGRADVAGEAEDRVQAAPEVGAEQFEGVVAAVVDDREAGLQAEQATEQALGVVGVLAGGAVCRLPISLVPTQPLIEFAVLVQAEAPFAGLHDRDQPGVAFPQDLMARARIALALEVQIPAQHGRRQHRPPDIVRRRQLAILREILQGGDLDVGKQRPGRQFRRVAAQQRHRRQSPGDHRVDRHRPLDPLPRPMRQVLHLAARLQHPVPVLDAPPQPVPFQHPFRILPRLHRLKWLRNGGQLRLRQMRQRSNCVRWCRIQNSLGAMQHQCKNGA